VSGSCREICDVGYLDCSGTGASGCNVDSRDDPHNCNGCGSVCGPYDNAMAELRARRDAGPVDARAEDGAPEAAPPAEAAPCPVGQAQCAGVCIDTNSDGRNCGGCGIVCAPGQVCSNGACTTTCGAGLTECSGDAGAYCANLHTDNANCGTCGIACPSGQVCSNGACAATCAAPLVQCGSRCAATSLDPENCGACGVAWGPHAHASAACINGACREVCDPGYLDCSGTGNSGCTVDPATDPNNCNGCGNVCGAYANATPDCTSGVCGYACNPGYLDCNGQAYDGCEIDGAHDLDNCGACGIVCATAPNAAVACNSGACQYVCTPPYLDCDGQTDNGCETNGASDANHCGACNNACTEASSSQCLAGACIYTLASGQDGPHAIAADGTNVYWADSFSIMKIGNDGIGLMTLAQTTDPAGDIATDGKFVYWTNGYAGTVRAVPVGGGTAAVVASGQANPGAIAMDGTSVYWTNNSSGSVMKAAVDGSDLTTLTTGEASLRDIATDGNYVYWVAYDGLSATAAVMKISVAGTGPVTLALVPAIPIGMSVSNGDVYWTTYIQGYDERGVPARAQRKLAMRAVMRARKERRPAAIAAFTPLRQPNPIAAARRSRRSFRPALRGLGRDRRRAGSRGGSGLSRRVRSRRLGAACRTDRRRLERP
jgi:Stigma-specific protein, Stig1